MFGFHGLRFPLPQFSSDSESSFPLKCGTLNALLYYVVLHSYIIISSAISRAVRMCIKTNIANTFGRF